jgi:hypothetical protein
VYYVNCVYYAMNESNVYVRKSGVAIKIPRRTLAEQDVEGQIKAFLAENPEDLFTVAGLMNEVFGVPAEAMKGPWSEWGTGLPALYGRVRRALDRLHEAKKVTKNKVGRGWVWGIRTE